MELEYTYDIGIADEDQSRLRTVRAVAQFIAEKKGILPGFDLDLFPAA